MSALRGQCPDAPVYGWDSPDRLTCIRCQPSLASDMKSDGVAKHLILAFLLALVCYGAFYLAIEHRRTSKGPWHVAFTDSAAGAPVIVVNQPSLGITNVQISFPGQPLPAKEAVDAVASERLGRSSPITNHPSLFTTLAFAQPRPVPYDVPFGKCVFMDTTFLPGTVTFRLLGHEIELLPRVLIIDHREHPWRADATIALQPAQETAGGSER